MDTVKVVNIVPHSLSGETNQDSEPSLAVNPANPLEMAASAFTPNPGGASANSPLFYSNDGGNTWSLLEIIAGTPVRDQTLRFATSGGNLYAGVLWGSGSNIATINFDILRTSDFTGLNVMTRLARRQNDDQPFVQAATVPSGPDAGKDRFFIGSNDHAPAHIPATIDLSEDAGVASPTVSTVRLEARTVSRDGFQTRPAIHTNGTVYAIFYAWVSGASSSDVVVVRDDNWGTGASPFNALIDTGDSKQGVRVVTGVNNPGLSLYLGQQRIGGDLSIAVDPNHSNIVYICWGDLQSGTYTLHVRKSSDSGATWGSDIRVITNATNPALAVNSTGRVGLLYQQVTGTSPSQRWQTKVELTTNNFGTIATHVLADTPASSPSSAYDPYLGDYDYMMAVGTTFYGIFSANNTPDNANFPSGVTYQRVADFGTKILKDLTGNTVAVSIDPFFFSVSQTKFIKEFKPEIKEIKDKDIIDKNFVLDHKPWKLEIPEKLQAPYEGGKINEKLDDNWQNPEPQWELLRKMAMRIDDLEQRLATARTFIEPSERPQVAMPAPRQAQAQASAGNVARNSARRRRPGKKD